MAMGAIVGVTSWQRTQEKLAIYRADSPFGGGSTVTEHTVERTSSSTAAPQTSTVPAKVNIKTDTVQVNTNTDATSTDTTTTTTKPPSRAD